MFLTYSLEKISGQKHKKITKIKNIIPLNISVTSLADRQAKPSMIAVFLQLSW